LGVFLVVCGVGAGVVRWAGLALGPCGGLGVFLVVCGVWCGCLWVVFSVFWFWGGRKGLNWKWNAMAAACG